MIDTSGCSESIAAPIASARASQVFAAA